MIKFKEILEGIFEEGTEEYEIIEECYDLITKTAPTVSAEAKTHMILLDHSRTKLATLHYMVCKSIARKRDSVQDSYNSQYARLVKLGRPSNAAIEAEIKASNADYNIVSKHVEALEQLKELITSYIRCIDASKQTTLEILRDSRRID